jgi:hypothetical protein
LTIASTVLLDIESLNDKAAARAMGSRFPSGFVEKRNYIRVVALNSQFGNRRELHRQVIGPSPSGCDRRRMRRLVQQASLRRAAKDVRDGLQDHRRCYQCAAAAG